MLKFAAFFGTLGALVAMFILVWAIPAGITPFTVIASLGGWSAIALFLFVLWDMMGDRS